MHVYIKTSYNIWSSFPTHNFELAKLSNNRLQFALLYAGHKTLVSIRKRNKTRKETTVLQRGGTEKTLMWKYPIYKQFLDQPTESPSLLFQSTFSTFTEEVFNAINFYWGLHIYANLWECLLTGMPSTVYFSFLLTGLPYIFWMSTPVAKHTTLC